MNLIKKSVFLHIAVILLAAIFVAWLSTSARAEGYRALKGVKQLNAVFETTLGAPKAAYVVCRVVRNVHDNESVPALS